MRIVLVRHAMAACPDGKNLTDFIVPLTPEGISSMELVAAEVKQREKSVLRIHTSPRKRTVQTAKILSKAIGDECVVEKIKELDLCGCDDVSWLEKACSKHDENSTFIFVGHEPGLLKLAEKFIFADSVEKPIYFSRGSALCLEFDGVPKVRTGKYMYIIHPGQLTQ